MKLYQNTAAQVARLKRNRKIVAEFDRRWAKGELVRDITAALCKKYGVSRQTIYNVRKFTK